MSVMQRRITAGVAGAIWVAWVAMKWWVVNTDHPAAEWRLVEEALMVTACLVTVTCILATLVSPIIATARIWYEIGMNTGCPRCAKEGDNAGDCVVVPIRGE